MADVTSRPGTLRPVVAGEFADGIGTCRFPGQGSGAGRQVVGAGQIKKRREQGPRRCLARLDELRNCERLDPRLDARGAGLHVDIGQGAIGGAKIDANEVTTHEDGVPENFGKETCSFYKIAYWDDDRSLREAVALSLLAHLVMARCCDSIMPMAKVAPIPAKPIPVKPIPEATRPHFVDYLLILLGAGLSVLLAELGGVQQPPAVPTASAALARGFVIVLFLSLGVVLLWPIFFLIQKILGRKQEMTWGEWLWGLAWLGAVFLTVWLVLKGNNALPGFMAGDDFKRAVLIGYVLFVVSIGILAVVVYVVSLVGRWIVPWTHTFGLALLDLAAGCRSACAGIRHWLGINMSRVLGLDIGGANLKAADSQGAARTMPFALWKNPRGLTETLHALMAEFPPWELLAVTMTGELCDCFATKREGVRAILDSVAEVAGHRPVQVWTTHGQFLPLNAARDEPLAVAAANWLAGACLAGRHVPADAALFIDMGSTTTDVAGIWNGQPVGEGRTDKERLALGELVYTGARRTPVCALLCSPLMTELFATTLDAYLMLELVADSAVDCDTADGRPATRNFAHARLAHAWRGWRNGNDGGNARTESRNNEETDKADR